MKIINSPKVIVTEEDLKKLLIRFVEKKTGKKVTNVDLNLVGQTALVTLNEEETELEEVKNG